MTDSSIRLATIASQNFTFELLINHDTSLGMELGCNLLMATTLLGPGVSSLYFNRKIDHFSPRSFGALEGCHSGLLSNC